ncbi:MAG TPA: hypothetical protein PLD62_03185 [Candidatus Cloacimonadota bacterium]|nr:hypothetical protein [Candidatus Cloacimonadota bacterium]
MNIQIVDESVLNDGMRRYQIAVQDNELIYFGFILESLEGWCNYTTPDKSFPVLQVDVAADFVSDFRQIYDFLEKWNV